MNFTITTDISILKEVKISSFAFEIRSDYGVLRTSGLFEKFISDPNEAEALCILNSLRTLKNFIEKNNKDILSNILVVINTDNKFAIKNFEYVIESKRCGRKVRYNKKDSLRRAYSNILNFIDDKWKVSFRYVKAHVPEEMRLGRHHVNEWCDKEAKRVATETSKIVKREIDQHLKNPHSPHYVNASRKSFFYKKGQV